MIALERLRPDDIDEVAALSARCFPAGGWTAADLESELARDFAEVWVARLDGEGPIVGYAVGWFIGDDGEILSIGTEPSVQRRGVGRALVERLEASASSRAMGLTLEVRTSNEGARALYARAGFAEVAVRRGYYADGEDARVMAWHRPRGASRGSA